MSKKIVFGTVVLIYLTYSAIGQKVFPLPDQKSYPYSIKSWTSADGLPQNSINSILQDPEGYIWVFTNEGAARFDGTKFKTFNSNNTPNLSANRLEDAVITKDGIIWCASSEGFLIRINSQTRKFSSFRGNGRLMSQRGIELDENDLPLVALPDGIYRFESDSLLLVFTHPNFKSSPIQNFVYNKNDKAFLISTYKGTYSADSGREMLMLSPKGTRDASHLVMNLNEDISGFSRNDKFYFFKNNKVFKEIDLSKIDADLYVGDVSTITRHGDFLLSTKKGVVILTETDTTIVDESAGLSSNRVRSVIEDNLGNIWVGTDDNGLNQLVPKLFDELKLPNPLTKMSVTGITWAKDSSLWFIRSCSGALQYRFKEKEVSFISKDASIQLNQPANGGDCLWTIYEDDRANVWLGGFGGAIRKYHGNSIKDYWPSIGERQLRTLCFRQLSNDQLWIGNSNGVITYQYSTDSFKNLSDSIAIPDISINHIFKDSKERVWLCSRSGIIKIHNGQFTLFNEQNSDLPISHFRYAYEDLRGNLWFGSYGKGLFFYEDDTFKQIPLKISGNSSAVSWIQEYNGKFWMTSNNGINAVDTEMLYLLLKGEVSELEALHFGKQSGLENDEFNGGFQSTGTIHDGKFYLPTMRGLVVFHPSRVQKFTPQKSNFQSIKVNGSLSQFDSTLILEPDFKRLEINLSTPNFNNEQNFKLEYKLEGFEDIWKPVNQENQITYTRLPSGSYKLKVRNRFIMNGDIAESSMAITVLRPFWREVWFIFTSASVLAIGIFSFLYFTTARSKRKELVLSEIVKEKTSELRKSRNNIRSIIESTQDLIWSIDKNANLIYANRQYIDRFQKVNGVRLYPGDNILKLARPQSRTFWEPIIREALSSKKPFRKTVVRNEQAAQNEEPFAVTDVTMTPITDHNSEEFLGMVGFSRDITQIRKQQEELEKTKQEALAAAKSKSEFLATMSHEIRTPMNGVIGMTSLLTQTALTKEQKEYVDTIRVSGDTLLSIINEILDFSKIDAGRLELESHPMDIEQVIKETFELVRTKAEEKNLELKCVVESDVPHSIYGDVTRIRQVLLNLTSNAVKFTKKGYVLIKVSNATEENNVQFSVIDTGIGIEDEKLNNLFKPFHQLDSSTTRKYGGTGLGLAISKKLIDLMQGEIFATSVKGQGSTFSFIIPAPSASADVERKINFSFLSNTRIYILSRLSDSEEFISALEGQGLKTEIFNSLEGLKKQLIDQLPVCIILDDYETLKMLDETQEHFARSQVIRILAPQENQYKLDKNLPVDFILKQPVNPQLFTNKLHTIAYTRFEEQSKKIDYHELSEQIPLKILVAEDNLINQKLVNMILNKLGYQPDIVANGAEAVSSIYRQNYDLIFMDLQMPEMDGFEATSEIIELYGTKRPFIIAMTANAMEGDREKCLENGMDDYVPKPINIDTVRDVIIKWG